MRITNLDPISMHGVKDVANAPFVVEGEGPNALIIYFESEANRAEYLDSPPHGSRRSPAAVYARQADAVIEGAVT